MLERFTDRSRQVIVLAQEESSGLKHDYLGTEHLLLGFLREEERHGGARASVVGVSADAVRERVVAIVGTGEADGPRQTPFTPRATKVLELGSRESLLLKDDLVEPQHLLLALMQEAGGIVVQALAELGVDREAVADKVRQERAGGMRWVSNPDWLDERTSGSTRTGIAFTPDALTPDLHSLLGVAAERSVASGRAEITVRDLLEAVEPMLVALGVEAGALRAAIERAGDDGTPRE